MLQSDDPFENAIALYEQGISLIPLNPPDRVYESKPKDTDNDGKHPATKLVPTWKQYQEQRATEDEIVRWFSDDCNIGVITGKVSNGLWVADFDDMKLLAYVNLHFKEPIENGTFAVKTGNGVHLYFRSTDTVQNVKFCLKRRDLEPYDAELDIKGEGGYVVGPGSIHWSGKRYAAMNELPIATIGKPLELIEKLREHTEEFWIVKACLPAWTPNHRHDATLGITAFLKSRGWPIERTENVFEALCIMGGSHDDWERDVKDTYEKEKANYHNYLDSTLADVLAKIVPAKKEQLYPAGEPQFKPLTFHRDGDLWLEQIEGKQFVKWNLKNGEHELVSSFTIGERAETVKGKKRTVPIIAVPVSDKCVESGQIILSKAPIPTDNTELSSIITEIVRKTPAWLFIDEGEKVIFEVQVRIAIASWFLYVFDDPRIPERVGGAIGILGASGSGKKRWGSIIQAISYRGLRIMGTNRVPSIYRLAEAWGQPTLIFEEADQKDTSSAAEFVQFYNSRYDGIPISRYNATTGKNDQFYSFGLSALILRRPLEDEGATNRTVWLHSKASKNELPEVAGPDMYDEFADIRARLLYLRLANMGKLKFTGKSELPVEDSWRVRESLTLFRLLSQLDPNTAKDLMDISKKLTEKEVEANAMTWDGIVLQEINDFLQRDDVVIGNRKNLFYAYKTIKNDKDEPLPSYPLTSQDLAKRFGQSVRSIVSTIRQFGVTTDRIRLRGRLWKGVLFINDLDELIYQFKRYVPNFDGGLLQKFTHQLEKYQDSVPDVPDVPGAGLSSQILKEEESSSVLPSTPSHTMCGHNGHNEHAAGIPDPPPACLSMDDIERLFRDAGVRYERSRWKGRDALATIPTHILEKSSPDLIIRLRTGGWRDKESMDRNRSFWTSGEDNEQASISILDRPPV